MNTEQQNGNIQLNAERDNFNKKVERLSMLGKTKKIKWSDRRRYRNI